MNQSAAHQRFERKFEPNVPKGVQRDALQWANWKMDHDNNVKEIQVDGIDMVVTYLNGYEETLRYRGGVWDLVPA